jgi:hypothetical protein
MSEQKTKMILVSLYCNGRRVQAFVKGTVGEDGKTRISYSEQRRLECALGAERGQTISVG